MHSGARTSFVGQLTRITANLVDRLAGDYRRIKYARRGSTAAFGLVDDNLYAYEALLQRLLEGEGWRDKFSEKHLDNKLLDILAETRSSADPVTVSRRFDELIDNYENFLQEHIVLIPLAGVRIVELDQLEIGRVVLKSVVGNVAEDLTTSIKTILMNSAHSVDEKSAIFRTFDANLLPAIRGKVCSECRVMAEPQRAVEIAEQETRRALDLLRFSIPFLYDPGDRVVMGLYGEVCHDRRSSLTLAVDGSSFTLTPTLVNRPFDLTSRTVDVMRAIGLFEVSELLRKPQGRLSEFEGTIIRAVHWCANCHVQEERGNALLSLVTTLETFLTPRDGSPIRAAIAEGLALISATSLESRKRLKRRVGDLYGKRSAVSHGGRGEILEVDLAELVEIATDLTVEMIRRRNEFQSQQALLDWIEEQKLGGTTAGEPPWYW